MILWSRDLTAVIQPKFYRPGLNRVKWGVNAPLKRVST